ncbi:hypothetical protein H5410_015880 [Solanum commersonii]|uniref:Uncharacterized protein n=1 Tax=Solanum commersonii TaxID=4109 RepID=A0A9J5ZV23_SOLCO|nr:hypothetical protein H5410_015880 [Solanum commersonii]
MLALPRRNHKKNGELLSDPTSNEALTSHSHSTTKASVKNIGSFPHTSCLEYSGSRKLTLQGKLWRFLTNNEVDVQNT